MATKKIGQVQVLAWRGGGGFIFVVPFILGTALLILAAGVGEICRFLLASLDISIPTSFGPTTCHRPDGAIRGCDVVMLVTWQIGELQALCYDAQPAEAGVSVQQQPADLRAPATGLGRHCSTLWEKGSCWILATHP